LPYNIKKKSKTNKVLDNTFGHRTIIEIHKAQPIEETIYVNISNAEICPVV